MPKGVAISYIIALILGIVIIALIGYWLFVLGGQTGNTGTTQICNAKQASWCQQWTISGFSGKCPLTQQPCATEADAQTRWDSYAPGCGTHPTADTCRSIFGQGGAGLSTSTTSSSSTSGSSGSSGCTGNPPTCQDPDRPKCIAGNWACA